MVSVEKEYMGTSRAKIWTYLILAAVLVIGVLVVNFALVNPDTAESGVSAVAGLPSWAFPIIVGVIGLGIFWMGLKMETDWPEGLGALMVSGSVAAAEIMIGWRWCQFGGITAIP